MPDQEANHEDEVVDGEVVGEFDDQTMINLPSLEDKPVNEAWGPSFGKVPNPGRRQFVTRLLIGSVASLALGGSAALVYDWKRRENTQPQVVVLPNGSEVTSQDASDLIQQISDLDYQLASVTAERDQLISDLNRTQNDLSDSQSQLSDALDLIDRYRGLIALWQQLDDIGLDDLVKRALEILGGALAGVMTIVTLLETGVNTVKVAIANFRLSLPGVRAGVQWLVTQIGNLQDDIQMLAEKVQEAVEPVEPFANLIAQFILWVLNRLPFGIGSNATSGLQAMQNIVSGLPDLADGVTARVFNPLTDWFGTDNDKNILGFLVDPVSEKVISPTEDILSDIKQYQTLFQQELADPVAEMLNSRESLRDQIKAAQARLGTAV